MNDRVLAPFCQADPETEADERSLDKTCIHIYIYTYKHIYISVSYVYIYTLYTYLHTYMYTPGRESPIVRNLKAPMPWPRWEVWAHPADKKYHKSDEFSQDHAKDDLQEGRRAEEQSGHDLLRHLATSA